MAKTTETWDLFISHASEDKKAIAEPLAKALHALGVKVWFDKFSVKLGDSLSRSIDRGLAKSRFGLVIISPTFIKKPWTEHELRGLTAIELNTPGRKVILPIWHKVSKGDVLAFSAPLADKLAVRTEGLTPGQIAAEIINVVRPDLATRILQRSEYLHLLDNAEVGAVNRNKLQPAPIRHEPLPPDLVGRIRLVRAALLAVAPHSMRYWLDGFQRDAFPTQNVAVFERIAAVYREYVVMEQPKHHAQNLAVYMAVRALDDGNEEAAERIARALPEGAFAKIRALFRSDLPPFDIEDGLPFTEAQMAAARAQPFDKEHFPSDLPETLVREYMGSTETIQASVLKVPTARKRQRARRKASKLK